MRILYLIIFCLLQTSFVLGETKQEIIDVRLVKQQTFPRIGGWCFAPWKGDKYTASILEVQDDKVRVRIFDTDLVFKEWPEYVFSVEELSPHVCEKSSTLDALVDSLKKSHKLKTSRIENAFRTIDRAWFCAEYPYFDAAIDIGNGMCISAPHMHALALELCQDLLPTCTAILDVGSGSGYLTALFAQLAPKAQVVGIDCFADLIATSQKNMTDHLSSELASRIQLVTGNGENGYLANAPYDIIYVGFMCKEVPAPLVDQLAHGGRMIVPVGSRRSSYDPRLMGGYLYVIEKKPDGTLDQYELFSCSFVPSISP